MGMTREKAVAYIRKNKAENFNDVEIRKALENAGWPQKEIDLAFIEARSRASATYIGVSADKKDEVLEPAMGGATFGQGNLVIENMWKSKETTPSAATSIKQGRTFSHGIKKAIVVAFCVLVLGAVMGGGFWYYKTSLAPNSLRASAISKISQSKQIGYNGRITLRVQESAVNAFNYSAIFSPQFAGAFFGLLEPKKDNGTEVKKIEIDITRDADWRDTAQLRENTIVMFDATEYLGNSFKYESRRFGDSLYFQLSGLPDKLPTIFGFDLAQVSSSTFSDLWMRADVKTISSIYDDFIGSIKSVDDTLTTYAAESAQIIRQVISLPADDVANFSKNLAAAQWSKESFQEVVHEKSAVRYTGTGSKEFLAALGQLAGGDSSNARLKKLTEALGSDGAVEVNMWVEKSTGTIMQVSARAVSTGNQSLSLAELAILIELRDMANSKELMEPTKTIAIQDAAAYVNRSLYRGFELSRTNKRDAVRMGDLEKIKQALSLYFDLYKQYPDTLTVLVPEFLAILPKDPRTQKNYQYKKSGAKNFTLIAQFENKQ